MTTGKPSIYGGIHFSSMNLNLFSLFLFLFFQYVCVCGGGCTTIFQGLQFPTTHIYTKLTLIILTLGGQNRSFGTEGAVNFINNLSDSLYLETTFLFIYTQQQYTCCLAIYCCSFHFNRVAHLIGTIGQQKGYKYNLVV